MSQIISSVFSCEGHQQILESFITKYQLELINIFENSFNTCALASTAEKEKMFIKIRGYKNNKEGIDAYQNVLASNEMAQNIKGNFMPKYIEFKAFERDDTLWITSMSFYGGEPISKDEFFIGNDSIIKNHTIKLLSSALEAITQNDSAPNALYNPHKVSMIIKSIFGHRVISTAPEWASAHCDLHWCNILDSGILIDWDTFSMAPKGLDAASIVLFSASNPNLFDRIYRKFFDILSTDSGQVATLLEAARILYRMGPEWKTFEPGIKKAVMLILNTKKIRWPKVSTD